MSTPAPTKSPRLRTLHIILGNQTDVLARVGDASKLTEKVSYFVIPSEARNLSRIETQRKRDSSARCAPRNDKIAIFSAACPPFLALISMISIRQTG
jgi:hypothetical protein